MALSPCSLMRSPFITGVPETTHLTLLWWTFLMNQAFPDGNHNPLWGSAPAHWADLATFRLSPPSCGSGTVIETGLAAGSEGDSVSINKEVRTKLCSSWPKVMHFSWIWGCHCPQALHTVVENSHKLWSNAPMEPLGTWKPVPLVLWIFSFNSRLSH